MPIFRIYHLLFALGVATAWLTAEELGLVHAWTGYAVGALLILRLGLGLAGQRGFDWHRLMPRRVAPPRRASGVGHPAIGNALTLALLLALAGTAGTGIAMDRGGTLVGQSIRADDGERGEGHEHREEDEDETFSLGLIGTARADDGEAGEGGEGEEEGPLGEIHETLGNLVLPLAALHVLWLLVFRLNMAKFMLFVPQRRRT